MTTAELLRTLRDRLGLSQTELGGKLGVSLNTIHVWEKGAREPSASHLQALAVLAKVRLSVGAAGWRVGGGRVHQAKPRLNCTPEKP